jgi:PAS domain S-box-containing protein
MSRTKRNGSGVSDPHCAIVRVDTKGVVLTWNGAAERMFGFTSAEAIGRKIELIIPPEFRARHWKGFHQFVRTGHSDLPELVTSQGLAKNGRLLPVKIGVRALQDANGIITGVEAAMLPIDSAN